MSLADRLRRRALRLLLPEPPGVVRSEPSRIASLHDEPHPPSERLLDVALAACAAARTIDLAHLAGRGPDGPRYLNLWPGEHYRLLAGLVRVAQPRTVVEIGTGAGWSALAILTELPAGGRLVTFDLVDWQAYAGGALRQSDFADGRLTQKLADLSEPAHLAASSELLQSAELIVVDGPKDGRFEPAFVAALERLGLPGAPLVFFDDTRFITMLGLWRSLAHPKLDLTSFGHWSGSGLVDWR